MTVKLYEGCWGVTRGGTDAQQEVVEIGKEYDGRWTVKSLVAGGYIGQWFGDGSADMLVTAAKNSRFDIIAVFATEAEADAYLAGKPAVNAPSFTFAPAPKPVTWPDGVTKMTIGPHQITIDAEIGMIQVVWHESVGSMLAQARQLAALLLAAADKVEGRG
jgi:hypothetical protein